MTDKSSSEMTVAEAMYLIAPYSKAQDVLLDLLERGALHVALRIEEHVAAIRGLLRKYRDTPMSLADACIVRMAEIHDDHAVLKLDSDFSIYRKHRRTPPKVIHPAVR